MKQHTNMNVRLHTNEWQLLAQYADAAGMSVTYYIREKCIFEPTRVKALKLKQEKDNELS